MKRPLVTLLACAVALPALAQDAPRDWDLVRDPAKKSVLAFSTFDVGLSVGFRCIDGSFNAVLAGLPPSRNRRRALELTFREGDPFMSMWTTTTDRSVAVSDFPAPLAREFRQGGQLQVMVPGAAADGRNIRYVVELPGSNVAIDEALTACDRPLVDPRDAELAAIGESELPVGFAWQRRPQPRFPATRYAEGFVVTTCLTSPDGPLRDCVVEMEHPHDGGFGEATLRAARRARVLNMAQPGAPVPVRRVSFRTNFVMP